MLVEAKAKEQYYQEVEANDKKVRSIRHDLKNRLIGILLGNLLDNAIEACEKTKESFIDLKIKYVKNTIFISISNSKNSEKVNIESTSKEDKENHGYGIYNIRNIVRQYGGFIEFHDRGNVFEISLSLNGIKAM